VTDSLAALDRHQEITHNYRGDRHNMHNTNPDGVTAIVTGTSRGFGRAIAIELVRTGAHVIGVARSEDGVSDLRREYGDKFDGEVADAADPSLPERLFGRYHPQILILNAGAAPVGRPLHEQTWETFSTNWHNDVHQVFNFAKASLVAPLAPGSVVVTISSAAALRGSPMSGGYAGAKSTTRFISAYADAEATSRSLGLRYVAVLPQLTSATDLGAAGIAAYAQRVGLSAAAFEEQLGPILTTEHVAKTIAEVASDHSYSAKAYLLTATELTPLD
jgi:NAD(P)-dependent dehydrogenase (short-subunit alcohol dehydrogenase family)